MKRTKKNSTSKLHKLILLGIAVTALVGSLAYNFYNENIKYDTNDAISEFNQGNYDQVIEKSMKIIRSDNASHEDKNYHAVLVAGSSLNVEPSKAVVLLEEIQTHLEVNQPDFYYKLSEVYLANNQKIEAAEALLAAIGHLDPEDPLYGEYKAELESRAESISKTNSEEKIN